MLARSITAALLALVIAPSGATAQSYYTVRPDGSGDAPTIQAAIDMAVSGDGILVFSGYYHEDDLLVDGKDLVFDPQDGIPVIIASNPKQGTGITFRNTGPASSLLGFEFRDFERGIWIDSGGGTYWYSRVIGCTTGIEISGALSAPDVLFSLVDSCGTGISVTGGSGLSIRNMTIVNSGTGIETTGGSSMLTRSIISGCGMGARCAGGAISLDCNNMHLNTADYDGCTPGAGDFYDLPRFCYAAGGPPNPYYLHVDSPCWAANNSCGLDVGAFTITPGCSGTATKDASWGAIKLIHR
jgi:hypothetical protein